jgi:hypothetical protein
MQLEKLAAMARKATGCLVEATVEDALLILTSRHKRLDYYRSGDLCPTETVESEEVTTVVVDLASNGRELYGRLRSMGLTWMDVILANADLLP